jgi:hypothetical protein
MKKFFFWVRKKVYLKGPLHALIHRQIKLLQKTLNSTDWIKKVLDDASKKGTDEQIESKPVGQKVRLLNLLGELLSESVEKVVQPASVFSRCLNCSKVKILKYVSQIQTLKPIWLFLSLF